eukprot:CAMPEP_0173172252 /NCGR_PEP_ID=MMETSP1141-20130122/2208_1 /TAXON_ID=483371 /ORGANISM="non described non described, Strain CCMP2298" /LENGTH=290 /DNA_ID=CAMNT_0014094273 /DNA_START=31 /DNA_END=899 /DNA_ORIENTATION=+
MSYLEVYQAERALTMQRVDYSNQNLDTEVITQIVSSLSLSVHPTTPLALDLSHNIAHQLPTLPNLTVLDISNNRVERPIARSAEVCLVELDLSYNGVVDLKGLALLVTLQRLNLQGNRIRHIEGLESMPQLGVLNLQDNQIAAVSDLRVLSYNSTLHNVSFDGNPIVNDAYFKVTLLSSVPCLKSYNGQMVWRRTSVQSKGVNDRLSYSELSMRTSHPPPQPTHTTPAHPSAQPAHTATRPRPLQPTQSTPHPYTTQPHMHTTHPRSLQSPQPQQQYLQQHQQYPQSPQR